MTKPRILQKQPYTDWMLYDRETDKLKIGAAKTQKQAIKKALSLGVVPRKTEDIRPMEGGYRLTLMTEQEFQEFMDSLS
ncbi:hypothetical protein [Candidatus Nanohalococcus occultus]|uniref:Uncharacterized protein n=1 Tax=Candidatus Nanohalococcus occultus TaxID=2978047 RepID=A0ABY8CFV6_9ARCH|nr:hypothetical protein SVXNc_0594 [Candidatus Nanohaloarchaeota archaeon SVXNc]